MKITHQQSRLLGALCILAGAIVGVLTEGKAEHVATGIMILGLTVMVPWVREKRE